MEADDALIPVISCFDWFISGAVNHPHQSKHQLTSLSTARVIGASSSLLSLTSVTYLTVRASLDTLASFYHRWLNCPCWSQSGIGKRPAHELVLYPTPGCSPSTSQDHGIVIRPVQAIDGERRGGVRFVRCPRHDCTSLAAGCHGCEVDLRGRLVSMGDLLWNGVLHGPASMPRATPLAI